MKPPKPQVADQDCHPHQNGSEQSNALQAKAQCVHGILGVVSVFFLYLCAMNIFLSLLPEQSFHLIVGESVPEATVKAIFLEEACELMYLALCAGEPAYYAESELAVRSNPGYDHFRRAWDYYRERLYVELDEE